MEVDLNFVVERNKWGLESKAIWLVLEYVILTSQNQQALTSVILYWRKVNCVAAAAHLFKV